MEKIMENGKIEGVFEKSIMSFVSFVMIVAYTWFVSTKYMIPEFNLLLSLSADDIGWKHMRIGLVPIIGYLLVSFCVVFLVMIFKEPQNHAGLVSKLIYCFKFSMKLSILLIVISFCVLKFNDATVSTYILTFNSVLMGVFSVCLICGLVVGLASEFRICRYFKTPTYI